MSIIRGIDYYGVLGITENAEELEIKQAYRRLALQYNAERQNDPEVAKLFVLAGEAYEVLSSELLRAIYDQYGEIGLKRGVMTPVGWQPPYVYHGDPVKTYREYFGTTSRYPDMMEVYRSSSSQKLVSKEDGDGFKSKQQTVSKPLVLTLEEVYNGAYKKIKIHHKVFKDGKGGATEGKELMLPIEVKPGLPAGTEIIFPNVGDCGPTSLPGDYVFVVEDKAHPIYKREGIDLIMVKTVSLGAALNGLIVTINTLDGREMKTRITDVIRPGYEKIVHGEGMPLVDDPNTFGNLIIKFNVEFPKYLPDQSRRLIDKGLAEAEAAAQELARQRGDKDKCDSICKFPSLAKLV